MLKYELRAIDARLRSLAKSVRGEDGQTMAEYSVILAVIIIAALAALQFLGGGIENALDKVTDVLSPAEGG